MSTPTNESKRDLSHNEGPGGAKLQHMVTLTAAEYESLYLTPKDARPAHAVTSTFANPVGMCVTLPLFLDPTRADRILHSGTISLVLVVLPWSLGQCNLADTNAVSYITLAPPLIFSSFVSGKPLPLFDLSNPHD